MSWWGKVLGGIFGYLVNGPFTALLGALIGHALDTIGSSSRMKLEKRKKTISAHAAQATYFSTTFSVMGHVSKADGYVSAEEIRIATQVMDQMDLTKPQREKAISLFNDGKRASFPIESVLKKLRNSCISQKNLLRMFMEIQIMAAMADGDLSQIERRLLLQISERLSILRMEYQRIEDRVKIAMKLADKNDPGEITHSEKTIVDAYIYLGIKKSDSDREVKKAYRKLLSQHHPDKLVSKGLPEEMLKLATQKTHEIRQAYEVICAARGI
ncbi:MAG: co-chaperone DjlA [Gammaproteobacteria bacterium]